MIRFIGVIILSSTLNLTAQTIFNPEEICGHWVYPTPSGDFTERWIKQDSLRYQGLGCFIQEGDTVFTEKLQIIYIHPYWTYIAVPQGHTPTLFYQTNQTSRHILFENPEHDFPNAIKYDRIGKDSMTAEVSGVSKDGGLTSQTYYFKKVEVKD